MLKRLLLLLALCLISFDLCAQAPMAKRIRFLRTRAESANPRIAANASYELARLARERRLHSDPASNDAEYQELLTRAAGLGHPRARLELAEFHLSSKVLRNQQQAFPQLLELMKVHPSKNFTLREKFKAFYLLGLCYETGKGTQVDTIRSQRFYRLASIGNSDARFIVLRNFNRGKDKTPVFELLYEICLANMEPTDLSRLDSFLAQNKLRDDFAAYLDRKSLAGDRIATMILADNLFVGGLFPKQRTKALECFRRAADQGNREAALRLADFHEKGLFGLAQDPVLIEKYYRLAFQDPRLRAKAAVRLADLSGARLAELASAPDKNAEEIRKLKEAYFYYLMNAEKYDQARKFIDSDAGQQFQEKDLYLKAKEYLASGGDPKQYRERLRMASNAGYPLAVIDFLSSIESSRRTPKQSAALLQALLRFPEPENPAWLWNVSLLYREGGKENPEFSQEKSLLYAQQAADMGSMDALEYLVRSYREGNSMTGIPADPARSGKYRAEILKNDIRLEKMEFFRQYADALAAKTVRTPDDFLLIFRSIGLSPFADHLYADFLFQGDSGMQIVKSDEHAMLMLHLAAREENFQRAVEEIVRRIQAAIKPNRTPDEVLQDLETISCYQSLL